RRCRFLSRDLVLEWKKRWTARVVRKSPQQPWRFPPFPATPPPERHSGQIPASCRRGLLLLHATRKMSPVAMREAQKQVPRAAEFLPSVLLRWSQPRRQPGAEVRPPPRDDLPSAPPRARPAHSSRPAPGGAR